MTETLSAVLPTEVEDMTYRLLRTACDKDLRLATAESCTGGMLASLLTDVEGCSRAFECGFIVYTNEAKSSVLGVPEPMLDEHGAVSREVAVSMAEGALDHSTADICLSITGFAGPAGADDETGLVHFACARRGRPTRHREEHFGDVGRGPTRIACMRVAVEMICGMVE